MPWQPTGVMSASSVERDGATVGSVVLVTPAVPYPGGGPGGGGGGAAAGCFAEVSALRDIGCATVVRLWQEHAQIKSEDA